METTQRFPNEELIESLCNSATLRLRESFPDHSRLWSACDKFPEVKHSFSPTRGRLTVEHSMIFRRAGGRVYKTVASNRIYQNALETISPLALRVIFEGWTKDFLEKVKRAKATREEVEPVMTINVG